MPDSLQIDIPRAPDSTRGNRPGVVPIVGDGRSSQTITTIIPAGKKFPISQAGSQFYLVLATAPVKIKPEGGSYNTYTQGTGEHTPQLPFRQLEVHNDTPNNVVISIFVGFGSYIDNRAILYNPLITSAVYSTFGVPSAAANLLIPDLSGQAFLDSNGNSWLALNRVALYISNLDSGLVYSLKNTAGTFSLLSVQPLTNVVFTGSGNFRITDGAALNLTVSEIYQAVTPTLT